MVRLVLCGEKGKFTHSLIRTTLSLAFTSVGQDTLELILAKKNDAIKGTRLQ